MVRSSTSSSGSTTERTSLGTLGAIALLAACTGNVGPASGPVTGPANPAHEAEAVAATAPDRPLHALFGWSLQEPDGRFSGRGSTRSEPPLRARLDLFGPRGEGYLSAALVDLELRLPPGTQDTPLPPPTLLWAAFGVFRPPVDAQLTGSAKQGPTLRLDYARGQERWNFQFQEGRLRSVEWIGPDNGRRTVQLEAGSQHHIPREAVYRDWLAFRELRLTLEEVTETNGFPADTWTIGGR